MKIELHEIPVREVAEGYVDSAENGVRGYGGRLNIRPAFQREFIYMAAHQHDTNCNELWLYFQGVVNWVDATFPNTRVKLMKGLDWGLYFNRFGTAAQDPATLEKRIVELLDDEDVTNQRGIYEYLLDYRTELVLRVLYMVR